MSLMTTPYEAEHLQGRVLLYLQVVLAIDVAAHVSDLVMPPLVGWGSEGLTGSYTSLRWIVSSLLVTGWAVTRFTQPRRWLLESLESVMTVGLAVVYGYLSLEITRVGPEVSGVAFSVLGVVLLLVVRAALVPSPILRTVAVGVASFGCAFAVARASLMSVDAVSREGMVFMSGAFVVATAVTSHVIYGLRRQVRTAMRLGQYQLGRKLGEGGMGIVYEATHLMLRRPTAVKLLPVEKVGERTVARFEREVQQTSRLEHPNSVRIYDYGRTPDGQFYYAMEYLDGVTLEQLVAREGPLPEARAAHILAQAAHALAEAHDLGLVHRDIKPANLMVCDRGRIPDTVKVLDFGLVKLTDEPEQGLDITHANTIVGTPQYLAPEAIRDVDAVGPASDVYALGAVGFFLVTGRHVFTGKSVVEICAQHLSATPERPSDVLGRAVDPDYEALIADCLEKDPTARPRDGAELADAIERLQLPGWTVEDARAWWDGFSSREADDDVGTAPTQLAADAGSVGNTQLAVDLGERG